MTQQTTYKDCKKLRSIRSNNRPIPWNKRTIGRFRVVVRTENGSRFSCKTAGPGEGLQSARSASKSQHAVRSGLKGMAMTQLSHMTATAVLEHDHRSIETVIVTMSTIADRLEQGRRIDTSLLTEVIFFLRIFAGQCQEAKEEGLLFPALQAKCVSDSACPVAANKNEHRKAGSLTLELLKAADAYAAGHASAPKSLICTLRALASLYRELLEGELCSSTVGRTGSLLGRARHSV